MTEALNALGGTRPERRTDDRPFTGQVVLVDDTGIHVAELDEDTQHPIGPCRGPDVEVGDVVLVVWTSHGPWVAQVAT